MIYYVEWWTSAIYEFFQLKNNLVLKKTTNDPQKETKNWQTLLQTGVNSGAPLVVPFMSLLLQIR